MKFLDLARSRSAPAPAAMAACRSGARNTSSSAAPTAATAARRRRDRRGGRGAEHADRLPLPAAFLRQNGQGGMGSQRTGADGDDIMLQVPVGTEILDEDEETVIADMTEVGQRVVLARGRQRRLGQPALQVLDQPGAAPRQPGPAGGRARGLAAAEADRRGRAWSACPMPASPPSWPPPRTRGPRSPTIPFTTLVPNLGVVGVDGQRIRRRRHPRPDRGRQSEGRGLGDQFLGHIERCAVLLHLVDGTSETIAEDYRTITPRAGRLWRRPRGQAGGAGAEQGRCAGRRDTRAADRRQAGDRPSGGRP